MIIIRQNVEHGIKIDNSVSEQVDSYKYLGTVIQEDGKMKEEINQRIRQQENYLIQ